MSTTFGPYETEAAAAAEPLAEAVRVLHRNGHTVHALAWAVRELQTSFLREACADAGVALGRHDERILAWLSLYPPATVQVVIGLISRAHAAGVRAGEAG